MQAPARAALLWGGCADSARVWRYLFLPETTEQVILGSPDRTPGEERLSDWIRECAMSTPTASPAKVLSPRCLEARRLACELLDVHGLEGWSFAFNRSKRDLGICRFGPRLIELSVHFVERNAGKVVRDTLLHEIAHALVGPGHGHDAVWRRMCL